MEQDAALKLFKEGGIFIFLDFPVGSEFGIDLHSWNTGEKFKGVKMIPPGMHYIYYSALNKENVRAPRSGFFHMFHKRDIVVRKWDPLNEELVGVQCEDQMEQLKNNLESLDPFLGPYPFNTWKKWVSLSSKLTVEVVNKIEPGRKQISSVANLIASEIQPSPSILRKKRILRNELENSLLPVLHEQPGTGLNFTAIPDSPYPEGATAAEITLNSLDTSYILEQLLSRWETSNQLLGELQMAFMCFLIGEVYSAFEHWKKLVNIFCSADRFLSKDSQLFLEFIEDLYFQMREVPADFFVDIVSRNNFLTQTLRVFFDNIGNCENGNIKLKKKCQQLKQYVTQKFQWDFEDEPDDEAPVIVELAEDN